MGNCLVDQICIDTPIFGQNVMQITKTPFYIKSRESMLEWEYICTNRGVYGTHFFHLNIKDMLSKLKESSSKSSKPQFCLGMFLSCQSTFSVFVWTLVHISEYSGHPCAYKTSANTPKLIHLLLQISSWMSLLYQPISSVSNWALAHISDCRGHFRFPKLDQIHPN